MYRHLLRRAATGWACIENHHKMMFLLFFLYSTYGIIWLKGCANMDKQRKLQTPEIYFDRSTIKLLRYIKRHKEPTLCKIRNRFPKDDPTMLLINLCLSQYIGADRKNGEHSFLTDGNWNFTGKEQFWITRKGKSFLDQRFDRLWQWSIPTLISIASLIISIISAMVQSQ